MPVITHDIMEIEDELIVAVSVDAHIIVLAITENEYDNATRIRITDAGGGDRGMVTVTQDRTLTYTAEIDWDLFPESHRSVVPHDATTENGALLMQVGSAAMRTALTITGEDNHALSVLVSDRNGDGIGVLAIDGDYTVALRPSPGSIITVSPSAVMVDA